MSQVRRRATRLGETLLGGVGSSVLVVTRETGGVALLFGRAVATLLTSGADGIQLVRALHRFGVQSVPVVLAAAFLAGVIVLLQVAVYVRAYGATFLVGWGSGFATLRELGPVLIALMVSGRVGARNAAELASMVTTEQVDALRALAIDPGPYLVVPRLVAVTVATFLLTLLGDVAAVAGSALSAWVLLDVRWATFWMSFSGYVQVEDFTLGLVKGAVFGLGIGLVSTHFGLAAQRGAAGVGRAVNRSVVGSAALVFVLDYLLTFVLA